MPRQFIAQFFALVGSRRKPFFGRVGSGGGGRRDNCTGAVLAALRALGAAFLVWELANGAFALACNARAVAAGELRNANQEARTDIAQRHRVKTSFRQRSPTQIIFHPAC